MNKHPRDSLIIFDSTKHNYTCNNLVGFTSVTGWVKTHFKHFDANATVDKIMSSRNWTKSKYFGKTKDEILSGWTTNANLASSLGTEMHKSIESYYNLTPNQRSEILSQPLPYIIASLNLPNHFINFVKNNDHLTPFRSEWMIFDESIKIAGSVDMLFEQPDGSLIIYDWKRCKGIVKTSPFNSYSTTDCIEHFPDTNFWHYALQLNMYKYIIEAKYEKTVSKMVLLALHPDLPTYVQIPVPVISEMDELVCKLRINVNNIT